MSKSKQLVGRVKSNPSKYWRGAEGLTLIVFKIEEDSERLLVIRPIEVEEMERFYRISYEKSMKEMISHDYDYCIWYLLDEDCELICEININDLEDIRELTEDDIKEHNKNLEEFKRIHKVCER